MKTNRLDLGTWLPHPVFSSPETIINRNLTRKLSKDEKEKVTFGRREKKIWTCVVRYVEGMRGHEWQTRGKRRLGISLVGLTHSRRKQTTPLRLRRSDG